jgi:pimeloyl-ACP methyl ester carboxylesterase
MTRALARLLALLALAIAIPAAAAPRSGFFQASGGVRLHYLDFGGRGDPVILLAGLGNTAWIYGDLGARLARHYRVYALTRRGHGDSDQPGSGYDADSLIEDVRQFLDEKGLARAHLIGHSLAGVELTRFASRYPGRTGALVYLDAAYDWSAEGPVDDEDPIASAEPAQADHKSVAAYIAFIRRTRPDLARYWSSVVERDLASSIAVAADGSAGWRTRPSTFAALLAGAAAAPPDYRGIRAPALALFAHEDEAYRLPVDASPALRRALAAYEAGPLSRWRNVSEAEFRAAMAAGELVEVESGHHLFLHHPDRVVELIEDFLARHPLAR